MRNAFFDFEEVLEASLDFGVPMPKKARTSLSRRLDLLREKLPVNASIDLHFFDEGAKLRGCLKIRTLNRTFSAISFGRHPMSIYENLEEDINQQILDWKQTRFPKEAYHEARLYS